MKRMLTMLGIAALAAVVITGCCGGWDHDGRGKHGGKDGCCGGTRPDCPGMKGEMPPPSGCPMQPGAPGAPAQPGCPMQAGK